jgi:O-antigen/teichoic acid export membrane protein
LSLFFGDQFRDGHLWLVILAFGYSSVVALGSPGWILQMIGSERLLLKLTAIASLFNVLLSLLLIKILGVTGVAISSAVTFLLLNLVASFSIYKKINVKTWAGFNP